MTADSGFVVIGAGQAGGRAVEAMRKAGFAGRIVLVGEEPHVPYERPPLSKQLLSGDDGPETTYLRDRGFYREQDIDLRLGARAAAIDPSARRVLLADGDELAYDKLLITTGSRVRRLAISGAELPGVFYLRDIEDALAIRARLAEGAALAVVGGGYIGLEVAAAARSRGCRVTVLEMEPTVMNRVVAPEVGRFFADVHEAQGAEVHTGTTVSEFAGDRRVDEVVCSNGTRLTVDLVVIGVGVMPDTALAEAAGLAVDDGIIVDEFGRTSDPEIFAAGDVTRHYNPLLGRQIRLESWQNAQNQAIAVARVMCGSDVAYAEVPWFWSDQYDLNLQMTGVADRWDQIVYRGDMEDRRFTVFYLLDGVLVAANSVNLPRDVRYARKLIESGARVDLDALADPAVPLKTLLEA